MKSAVDIFSDVTYGLLEGILIFIGIFILTKEYLLPAEHEGIIEMALKNIDIYFPVFISEQNKRQLSDVLKVEFDKNQIKEEAEEDKIKQTNKDLNKNFNTTLIVTSFIILGCVIIHIMLQYKKKGVFLEYGLVILGALIIILFEFIFMKYVINSYWTVHIGEILKKVSILMFAS
jgi:hypothetical protein